MDDKKEGVVKFNLKFSKQNIPDTFDIEKINHWRSICMQHGWLGQDAKRYEGLGFGNISLRHKATDEFIISGTQTGNLKSLAKKHFAKVNAFDISKNQISALGLTKPSSESMTHAVLYQKDKRIKAVIHIHAPEIWQKTHAMGLKFTPDSIAYGTVAMARAVEDLLAEHLAEGSGVFSMLGHEDGLVAFAEDLDKAGSHLLDLS